MSHFTPATARSTPKRQSRRNYVLLAISVCSLTGIWYGFGSTISNWFSNTIEVEQNQVAAVVTNGMSDQLTTAQSAIAAGDTATARTALADVVVTANEYNQALLLLTQTDLADGDVSSAIVTMQKVVALDPNNPIRRYQLGVLQTADGQIQAALESYGVALALDPQYANARYMRALLLAELGQTGEALRELEIVQTTNQSNAELAAMIAELASTTVATNN